MHGRFIAFALLVVAGDAGAASAASLGDTYAALRSDLAHSPFGQPLILASREQDGQVTDPHSCHSSLHLPLGSLSPRMQQFLYLC